MHQLTTKQAERLLNRECDKKTDWQKGAGIHFRIYRVPPGFNVKILPLDFKVLLTEGNGNLIIIQTVSSYRL